MSDNILIEDERTELFVSTDSRAAAVVCCYTEARWAQLTEAINSLLGEPELDAGIVVVVDHNTQLLERLRSEFPDIKILPSEGPKGLSGARNTGVRAAEADIVLFLDDDAKAEPGWVPHVVGLFADPRVQVVGTRIEPIWEGGRRPAWFPEEFFWVIGCTYRGLPNRRASVRNPIGAAMAMRSSAIDRVGGFSNDLGRVGTLPVGCEETEICLRVQETHGAGAIIFDPEPAVRHHAPKSRQRVSYFTSRCFHEGRSKAIVSRLATSRSALGTERKYVVRTLPSGVLLNIVASIRSFSVEPLFRATMIPVGLGATVLGYAMANIEHILRRRA